jgi:SPP1 family predicted phage head-tail adaptor
MTDLLLDNTRLEWIRDAIQRTLPGTAIVQRLALSADGAGGVIESWSAVGTYNARLDPIRTNTQIDMVGKAEGFQIDYNLTLPHNAAIAVGDRVLCDGVIYEVRRLASQHDWRTAVQGLVTRVSS